MRTPVTNSSNDTKDAIFGSGQEGAIKSTSVADSGSKALTDATRLTLRLRQEGVKELIEALTNLLDNERGVTMDIHFGYKTSDRGTFPSSFFFVKPIQDPATFQKPVKKVVKKSYSAAEEEAKNLG